MIYFKSVLVGCAGSALSGIVYLLISFVRSFSAEVEGSFMDVGMEFTMGPLLLIVLLAGFVAGFFWMLSRSSRPVLS